MGPMLLLALQTADPAPAPIARIDFDLARVQPAEADPFACDEGGGDEIIVCGRVRRPVDRFTSEEMEELARRYAEGPPRAAMDLGDRMAGSLDFSPTVLPGNVVSNRMMVTVKLPF